MPSAKFHIELSPGWRVLLECRAVPQQGGCNEQLLISCHYRDCAGSWHRSVTREEGLQERRSRVVCSNVDRSSHKNAVAGLTTNSSAIKFGNVCSRMRRER
jgi:hypothetical protein